MDECYNALENVSNFKEKLDDIASKCDEAVDYASDAKSYAEDLKSEAADLDDAVEECSPYCGTSRKEQPSESKLAAGKDQADYKKVGWKRNRMNVATEALIWATMHVGMPSITNDNWVEFYRRVHIMEKMTSTMRNRHTKKKPIPVWFEAEEVKQHIGLRTTRRPGAGPSSRSR